MVTDRGSLTGQTALSSIQAATARLQGAIEIGRLTAEVLATYRPFAQTSAKENFVAETVVAAVQAWADPPFNLKVEKGRQTEKQDTPSNNYAQASPGMIVQFAIYGLVVSAMVLVLERKTGALRRLLVAPISRAEIIGGHVLAMFVVVFLQQAVLIVFGQLIFKVDYVRQPLAILLVMLALCFWTASLGLLIGTLAKKEDQVIMWTLVAMFILAAMGGAWFPLEFTGRTFATLGHLLPSAWAMDGFQNIVVRGLDWQSVLLPTAILLAYGTAFLALAVRRFRFE